MKEGMSRLLAMIAAAVMVGTSVNANTIQPILVSETGPVGGNFTYTYDLQLTPNNGLSSNASKPSSVTIFDFGTVSGVPVVSLVGGDVTAATDWAVTTAATGAALPNAVFASGTTTITGDSNQAAVPDSATLTNVTVKYTGAGLTSALTQRSLIQLQVVSNLTPGPLLQSISMNTAFGANQADTFPVQTSPPIPEPTAACMIALAGCGLLWRRRS